jgi:hypothetical protein
MAIGLWLITSFGAKGIGEDGAVGPPAAIVSAVNDALQGMDVEFYNLPLSPQRILDAIETAPGSETGRKALRSILYVIIVLHNTWSRMPPRSHPFPWLGPITRPPWEIGGKCKQRTSESNDDCEDDRGIPKHTTPQARSCPPPVS